MSIIKILKQPFLSAILRLKVGKDTDKRDNNPLFEPPKGYLPASMKYIYKTAFDDKVISAAIINMAVKVFIDIDEYDGKITLMKKDNPKGELSRDDKVLYEELFKFSLLYLSYLWLDRI